MKVFVILVLIGFVAVATSMPLESSEDVKQDADTTTTPVNELIRQPPNNVEENHVEEASVEAKVEETTLEAEDEKAPAEFEEEKSPFQTINTNDGPEQNVPDQVQSGNLVEEPKPTKHVSFDIPDISDEDSASAETEEDEGRDAQWSPENIFVDWVGK